MLARGSVKMKKTNSPTLQSALDTWLALLLAAFEAPSKVAGGSGVKKEDLIDQFVRSFVPLDVEEEDIVHYSSSLKGDQVRIIKYSYYTKYDRLIC